ISHGGPFNLTHLVGLAALPMGHNLNILLTLTPCLLQFSGSLSDDTSSLVVDSVSTLYNFFMMVLLINFLAHWGDPHVRAAALFAVATPAPTRVFEDKIEELGEASKGLVVGLVGGILFRLIATGKIAASFHNSLLEILLVAWLGLFSCSVPFHFMYATFSLPHA
ncbi:hypothetical protein ACJX0J_025159, partial [Zea mays]